jgi:predicted  nucleic acid-binding Zn-ribbon protein
VQRSKLIGTREEEIKNLEAAIQQKTNQIQELTQQIEAARKNSGQIRSEINESTVKIEKTKSDFDATFVTVVEQLQNDAAKIKQYL